MIVSVASFKGGVGKTTTAVHLAAYLNTLAPTLLLDADSTKNATAWSQRGQGFGFRVAGIGQAAKLSKDFQHVVIDTGQRPSMEDLKAAAEDCDLLVIPAVPASLDTDGLGQTLRALKEVGATGYRVLLTKVPPYAAKEATELRGLLAELDAAVFVAEIPRLTAFEKAATHGQIVNHTSDKNAARAWEAYAAAGREITL